MELSTGYVIILGIIVLIGLIGMVGNIQLSVRYRGWLESLRTYETTSQLTESRGKQPVIDDMIDEYKHHRSSGIEQVNTQAIIEKKVYGQQLPMFGLFRLPIGVVERILQQLPAWAVIVGLLGTFTGLTIALLAMQNTLLQLGTDMGEEIMTVSTIVSAIAEPFRGMSFAFMTSIAGIGTSFLLHVLHSGLLSKLGVGPSFSQYKNLFMTRCESFLDHQVQHAVQQEKPQDTLEKILDRLVAKVKQSFDESVKGFADEIVNMADYLKQSTSGLEQVIEQSATFTAQFEKGTSDLTQFGHKLGEYIEQFQHKEEHVAGQMGQLSQNIATLGQEFKQLSAKNDDSRQALQRVVERSDQLIQQTVRKNEELFQFFQKNTEDMQRTFQEQMADERRQYTQQQEEWSFKYQDKNDQFSRAAESFGQAVHHLERQMGDGLERYKRDLVAQWSQVMERYFGRQQAGSGQEREWREIMREIEMIAHMLEREFQTQHRIAQETHQILLSIYEWGRNQVGGGGRYTDERGSYRRDERVPSDTVNSPVIRGSGY